MGKVIPELNGSVLQYNQLFQIQDHNAWPLKLSFWPSLKVLLKFFPSVQYNEQCARVKSSEVGSTNDLVSWDLFSNLTLAYFSSKLTGMAFRVPTPNVSVVDLTVRLEKPVSKLSICYILVKCGVEGIFLYLQFCSFIFKFFPLILDMRGNNKVIPLFCRPNMMTLRRWLRLQRRAPWRVF